MVALARFFQSIDVNKFIPQQALVFPSPLTASDQFCSILHSETDKCRSPTRKKKLLFDLTFDLCSGCSQII